LDIAAGATYIDPSVSYLTFKVIAEGKTPETDTGTIALGNGISYIRESILRSRTGVELSRSVGHDLARYHSQNYRVDTNYYSSVGAPLHDANATVTIKANEFTQYCLPLSDVNPFFGTSVLIPSDMGQMRLEINLNPHGTVFSGGTAEGYTITDVRVVCKVYELSDTALKRLSFIASQTGLTIPFTDVHSSIIPSPASSINAVSLKSASKALIAYAAIIDTTNRNNPAADSVALRTYVATDQFQFSLGSAFVTSEPVVGIEEAMIQANEAFGLWGRSQDNVSNRVDRASFASKFGLMACNLERSATLEYNGSAVSSSRPLLLQAKVGAVVTSEVHLFLEYLRLVVVMSDSNIVLLE
jgi:hypothetical protein